jgi:hypothetical protein
MFLKRVTGFEFYPFRGLLILIRPLRRSSLLLLSTFPCIYLYCNYCAKLV